MNWTEKSAYSDMIRMAALAATATKNIFKITLIGMAVGSSSLASYR